MQGHPNRRVECHSETGEMFLTPAKIVSHPEKRFPNEPTTPHYITPPCDRRQLPDANQYNIFLDAFFHSRFEYPNI
jgi:hypothetical protein